MRSSSRSRHLRSIWSIPIVALIAAACTPAPDGPVVTAPNPTLMAGCGLDVSMLIDRSGSIGTDNVLVAEAAQVLVDALAGSGSRVKLASFADHASVHPDGDADGTENIGSLDWSDADGYSVPVLPSDGGTNLEGGLEVLRRSPTGSGDLTVVFTDGNPNVHYLNLGDGHPGVHANLGYQTSEAISESNRIKATGSHLLAVGVGDVTEATLQAISGEDELTVGTPIEDADFAKVESFSKLGDTFTSIASKLCENTANVLTTFNGTPVAGSIVDLTADPAPSEWTAPPGASGSTATDSTSATAAANFGWKPGTAGTTIGITATPTPGFIAGDMVCEEDPLDGSPRVPVAVTPLGAGSYELTKSAGTALYCVVDLEANIDLPPKVDVVLSFDLTSSMSGVVAQAKAEATEVIGNLGIAAPATDFQFGVTSFRDYPTAVDASGCGLTNYSGTYGSGSDFPFLLNQSLSGDAGTVQAAVNALTTSGGADGPESYSRALWELTQKDTSAAMAFRTDALRLVINFGDNVPHDPNLHEGVQAGTWDTGLDLGRNGALDCGGDDLDFQNDTLASMIDTELHLLHVNAASTAAAHWQHWAGLTGGGYAQLSTGQSLTQVVVDLLSQL